MTVSASQTGMTPLDFPLGEAHELLIEASAGTGKTYALTTLLARLLVEERAEIGELLVVTFTMAATGELRDRVRATLRAVLGLARGEGDEEGRSEAQARTLMDRWRGLGIDEADVVRRLDLALLDLDRANVMTIHGFCQRLLADFAFDGGLPFGFEVAGDGSDTLNAAVGDEWRRWSYPASALLVRYAEKNGFSADKLPGWVAGYVSRPDLDIVGVDASTEESSLGLDGLELKWGTALGEANRAFEAEGPTMPVDHRTAIEAAMRRPGVTFVDPKLHFSNESLRTKLLDHNPSSVLAEALSKLEEVSTELREKYDGLLASLRRDALVNTRATMERRVREDRRLGFDDLLTGVHRALRDHRGLAARIRERYPWALIDEYQDTDRVQAEIFRRIYGEGRRADDPGALVIVGDPKQSIYRFRSADIFAYLSTSENVSAEAKLDLVRNYRSVPALTEAVNAVFDHPCPFALDGIEFKPAESAVEESRLRIDGETVAEGGDARFQIRYVPWLPGRPRRKADVGDMVARLASDEIAALLSLADRGKATWEGAPLRGSDIAVLVRKAEQGKRVARALHERGIASVEIGIENVLASREAEQLERVLWAIAKPQSPRRTRGALAADVFGLGAAGIDALQDDDLAWNTWTERLGSWLEEWQQAGVATLIRHLLESEDVKGADHLLRYRDGARRLTNLKHLAELLQAEETRERYSPTGLAAWFTRQRANAGDRDEVSLLRLDSDEQLVKIVTMHAAKGLEFPVVFCPFLWDAGRPDDNKAWADYHRREPGHPEVLDLNPSPEARNADWLEQFSDETRLLYVALTRARERCVVTWTKVQQTENAPFSWLLYGHETASGEVGPATVRDVAKEVKSRSNEVWRQGLDDLASRCSADIGIVDVAFEYESASGAPSAPEPVTLDVRRLDRRLARIRQMTSYSALVHGAGVAETPDDHGVVEQPDRDEDVSPENEDETPAASESTPNAFTFPAGRRAGNCLHRIFERLDRGEEESVESACREGLGRYRIDLEWLGVARSLVENTRTTVLTASDGPGAGMGFRLGELERPVPEMEFHVPLEGLDRNRFGQALAEYGYANPFDGSRSSIEGFLRGFIDLVAGHDGVWYVLDYKSNWLGNRAQDYRASGLARAMGEHRYPLQYLLYLVALHRYLAVRLPGYDYDTHVGGAFYLFLRGIDPAAGMDRGIYFDRPSRACIEALDACFRGAS